MGRKCLWKTCMFLQREIIIHTTGCTTKEAFHFKLQGRCWFPKSYWLKKAQLRSGRGAVNGDSAFSLPPLSSCEPDCCLALKGGKQPPLHKTQCCHSHVCVQFWEVSSQKARWKQVWFCRILSAHMPQFTLIAIAGIPHHLDHLQNMRPLTQAW